MKATDLDILLQEGEGAMLEYKEGLFSSFARELVAFANTAGGRILLGVRDDGTVKGIADTNELRARIQDIAGNCDPPMKILLHRIAFIEKAGTGIRRMRDGARDQGYPEPEFSTDSFFTALFRPLPQATPQVTYPSGTKPGPSRDQDEILRKCLSDSGIKELMANVGRINRSKFRDQVLNPLIEAKLIEMILPDKPRSPKQRYRTTAAGRSVLENSDKESQS